MAATVRYWVLQTVAMMVTAALIPRLRITSILGAVGIVGALALVNATIWDTALFFSVPKSLTLETVTLLVANGLLFWGLVKFLPGIEVDGIIPALVAPIVFTAVSLLVGRVAHGVELAEIGRALGNMVAALRDWLLENAAGSPSGA